MKIIKQSVRLLLKYVYRVKLKGADNFQHFSGNTIIIANHTSYLDVVLLYAFLPVDLIFAVNVQVAKNWMLRIAGRFFETFPIEPTDPMSMRSLIKRVEEGGHVVIFPEGRLTVTGSLMKIYQGPALVAIKTGAQVLPISIEGAQYTPFTRLRGRVRRRWFPEITITILPPNKLEIGDEYHGHLRREKAGKILSDTMTNMVFQTMNHKTSLFDRLLDARRIHGGKHIVGEDINRVEMDYNTLLTKSLVLGKMMTRFSHRGEYVGLMMPGTLAAMVAFWGLHAYGRVPAMLNFSAGARGMLLACETARIKTVVTARKFILNAGLEGAVEELSRKVEIVYLEDVAGMIPLLTKLRGLIISRFDWGLRVRHRQRGVSSDSPAVVLFTSGSEGTPKGVVLSHENLLANINQLAANIDFNPQDIALNSLPLFHSFGLTAGALLPMIHGMKTFLYPSPLHYRVIPEIAYEINATLMFGTNTFLANYAKHAHPYDFFSLRYVFAGAEKLQNEVRNIWESKFGVRIFEGYGATEASPVVAVNTPMANKPGSVGRLMTGMEYRLAEVPGLKSGSRLFIKGPNVMLGYLLYENPGKLVPPDGEFGPGWYDTGDIVDVDDEGFITISGRAKRFAKVAGEMVSLTAVESLAGKAWPNAQHAAIAVPDTRKGEQIVLMTTQKKTDRTDIVKLAHSENIGDLYVPKKIMEVVSVPVLGSGKTDYVTLQSLVEN